MRSDAPQGWKTGQLSDVLQPTIRNVVVESTGTYRLLGVRWYCAGPRHHDTFTGADLKTTSLNLVSKGQVTYNKMWVKKGAFAVLGESEHGLYATTEYPTFDALEDKLDLRFMKFLMQTEMFQASAAALCKGTTSRARLNPNDFLKLELPLPPLAEQRKIAAILTSVDEAIQATEAVIAQTRRVKEGLLQELLTRGIGHTRFKQTEIGEMPEGWEVKRLVEVSTAMNNGFVGTAADSYTESGRVYLRGTNVRANRIDLDDVIQINEQFYLDNPKTHLNPGDVVTVQSGHIGTSAVIGEELKGASCHALIITRPIHDMLDGRFLAYYLNSECGAREIEKIVTGSTIQHVNTKDLRRFRIPLPPVNEQREIAAYASAHDESIAVAERHVSNLKQLKSGLLQDLLTGQVRVTP